MRTLVTLALVVAVCATATHGAPDFPVAKVLRCCDPEFRSAVPADIDADGDSDLVIVYHAGHLIGWHENVHGNGSEWAWHPIPFTQTESTWAAVGDADGDGTIDVLSAWGSGVVVACVLYHNTAGDGTAWTRTSFGDGGVSNMLTYWGAIANLDGDGDNDLVVTFQSSVYKVAWWENVVGDCSVLTYREIVPYTPAYIEIVDFDGNGAPDVLSAGGYLDWWLNSGDGTVWTRHLIAEPPGPSIFGAARAADLNGDGVLDVVAAASSTFVFMWNGTGYTLDHTFPTYGAGGLDVADVDNDNDADLLVSEYYGNKHGWYENDGMGGGWTYHAVSAPASAWQIYAIDIDGDTALDIVTAEGGSTVLWWRNILDVVTAECFATGAPAAFALPAHTLTVHLRSNNGSSIAFVPTYNFDALVVATLTSPASVPLVIAPSPAPAPSAVTLDVNLPELVEYTLTVYVAGAQMPGSPFVFNRDVAAHTSSLRAPPPNSQLDALVPLDDTEVDTEPIHTFVVDLRTGGGAPASFPPAFDYAADSVFTVTAMAGLTPAPIGYTWLNASSVAVALYRPPVAGTYTVAFAVDRVEIVGSPVSLVYTFVCQPGFHQVGGTCVACERDFYLDEATTVPTPCTPCPTGTGTAAGGASSFRNCTCAPGLWFGPDERTASSQCVACPDGAVCSGGNDEPVAAPGFYATGPYTYTQCTRVGCMGAQACAPGYGGYMCSECADGYYSRSESQCLPCPPTSAVRLYGIAVVLVVGGVVVAAYVAFAAAKHAAPGGGAAQSARVAPAGSREKSETSKALAFRKRTLPVSLSMITLAFQVVGVVASAQFSWTERSSDSMAMFGYVNIDGQAVAAECSLSSFHVMYALSVSVPLAMVVYVAGVVFGVKKVGARKPTGSSVLATVGRVPVRVLMDGVVFTLGPVLYIPVSKAALVLFDCSELPNGDVVLDADNGVACFDDAWYSVLPFGIVGVLFVGALPGYFGWMLLSHRKTLFEPDVAARFGSLYRAFRRPFYWTEMAQLGKRIGIVCTALFFSQHQLVQIVSLQILLGAWLLFAARYRPYHVAVYNGIEMRLSVCVIGFLVLGIGSYAERAGADGGDSDAFYVLTLCAVVCLVVVSAHALVSDVVSLVGERRGADGGALDAGPRARLASAVAAELADVDASPELRSAAESLVALLARGKDDAEWCGEGVEMPSVESRSTETWSGTQSGSAE